MRLARAAIVAVWAVSGLAAIASADETSPPVQRSEHTAEEQAQFDARVREYILAHPEVLIEALNSYRAQLEQKERQQATAALTSYRDELQNDPNSPVVGNPDGAVTIVEFFDYRCSYCARVLPAMQELLASDDGIRYVFKEYPVLGPDSVTAARASLAVWDLWPDRYMDFHSTLLKSRGGLNEDRIFAIAKSLDLDADAIKERMQKPDIDETLQKNYALGRALNVNGTPAFIVGNQFVPGAIDLPTLRQLVEVAREG